MKENKKGVCDSWKDYKDFAASKLQRKPWLEFQTALPTKQHPSALTQCALGKKKIKTKKLQLFYCTFKEQTAKGNLGKHLYKHIFTKRKQNSMQYISLHTLPCIHYITVNKAPSKIPVSKLLCINTTFTAIRGHQDLSAVFLNGPQKITVRETKKENNNLLKVKAQVSFEHRRMDGMFDMLEPMRWRYGSNELTL